MKVFVLQTAFSQRLSRQKQKRERGITHHPQLMREVADEHGPVLRRIRVVFDLFRDHLAQPRVLGEPPARHATDGMPSHLDRPRSLPELGLGHRDCIRLLP